MSARQSETTGPTTTAVDDLVKRTTRTSGVPVRVEDPATVDRIATLLRAGAEGVRDATR